MQLIQLTWQTGSGFVDTVQSFVSDFLSNASINELCFVNILFSIPDIVLSKLASLS